ncbi:MAG: hypothetical protein IPH09_16335 [bacterium]|nr:hypothetical protein [bacterium]
MSKYGRAAMGVAVSMVSPPTRWPAAGAAAISTANSGIVAFIGSLRERTGGR